MYNIEVNEKQARVLIQALDLYSRLLAGQLDELNHLFVFNGNIKYNAAEKQIDELKAILFPDLIAASSYGICGEKTPNAAKIAFDIQQAVRNAVAWDKNPEGGFQVDFDKPYKTSNEPIPKVTVS